MAAVADFIAYVLSFIYIGIYWNNHHHLFVIVEKVNGGVLWANIHLLFWLSLLPFVTAWASDARFARDPVALYGVVLLGAAMAYSILVMSLLRAQGGRTLLHDAIGRDVKGWVSITAYVFGSPGAFLHPWIATCSMSPLARRCGSCRRGGSTSRLSEARRRKSSAR